jgi:hypothetical protein
LNKTYHFFYQFHSPDDCDESPILPFPLIAGEITWGHAVSTDLVHWTIKPIIPAFFPVRVRVSGGHQVRVYWDRPPRSSRLGTVMWPPWLWDGAERLATFQTSPLSITM